MLSRKTGTTHERSQVKYTFSKWGPKIVVPNKTGHTAEGTHRVFQTFGPRSLLWLHVVCITCSETTKTLSWGPRRLSKNFLTDPLISDCPVTLLSFKNNFSGIDKNSKCL